MMSILTGLKKYTKCVNAFITSKFLSRVRGHCFCDRVRTGSERQTRTSLFFFTLSNVTLLRPSAASLLDRLIWLEFYVLLIVHLGSVLVNNQLDAQFFFRICLFQFSTCFEQPCAHHQENQLYQYDTWYI